MKAVRFDAAGGSSAALDSTVRVTQQDMGASILVEISIADEAPSRGVTLELSYDAQHYRPVGVQFAGLIDTPVEMSVIDNAGRVSLGQVDTQRSAVRSGRFASVQFERRPFARRRTIQAVHSELLNTSYTANGVDVKGFQVEGGLRGDAFSPVQYVIRSLFAIGDGNGDGESNIADLTPVGQNFGKVVAPADLYPACADYDRNGEVNIADLTALGGHFGESTGDIEILAGDASVGGVAIRKSAWVQGNAAAGKPAVPTSKPADVWRSWSGEISVVEQTEIDLNFDGAIFISARAKNGEFAGEPFDAIQVGGAGGWGTSISGIYIQIVGATGGSGGGQEGFLNGDTATVTANSSLTLNVSGISGEYDGVPFTPADAGGAVPQTEYDAALAAAQALVTWTTSTTGTAGMRGTAPVLALSGNTGTGISATVFPDDDPESSGGTPEGTLSASTSVSGAFMPGALTVSVGIDVTVDAAAAVVEAIACVPDRGLDANGDLRVDQTFDCTVLVGFNWGSGGAPANINGATIGCSLFDFGGGVESAPFAYVAGDPANPGEFSVAGGGPYTLKVMLSPAMVEPGSHYGLRILDLSAGGVFNSCNKPGNFLVAALP